jgi:Ser/Thr protein kinase RdoA (MazF antagonist)
MEERIRSRFTPQILAETAERFGITPNELIELDGFESFIYAYELGGEEYILRIAHSLRRNEALIRGEVDWINYLVEGGAGASQVILSKHGNLVEVVDDQQGGNFLATVFEKAPGITPRDFGYDDALYRSMGMAVGQLHRLTKEYQPIDPMAQRPHWDDPIMLVERVWMPESEQIVWEKYVEIMAWCRALPQDRENYGLIHFDVHGGNFFVDGTGSINLFDFDDCHYSWFANDIAIVLFYMQMGKKDPVEFSLNFMRKFIVGYQIENKFNPAWLVQIPKFLKMREIDLYAIIHRSFDLETTDDEWILWYMDGRKTRIEGNVPVVDADFCQLADLIEL